MAATATALQPQPPVPAPPAAQPVQDPHSHPAEAVNRDHHEPQVGGCRKRNHARKDGQGLGAAICYRAQHRTGDCASQVGAGLILLGHLHSRVGWFRSSVWRLPDETRQASGNHCREPGPCLPGARSPAPPLPLINSSNSSFLIFATTCRRNSVAFCSAPAGTC